MFHREAPEVPAPDLVQVLRQVAPNPGQPQRHRLAMLWQMLDLHAHDGERSSGRILDVQTGPDFDCHGAVHRVLQAGRAVGWAMGAGVLELEDRAMCVRSTAARVRLRRAAKDAVLGQAHHQVRLQVGLGKLAHLVSAVQCHHRSGRLGCLAGACLSDLMDGHLRRGLGGGPTRLYVQRQHPAALWLRHLHQPVVGPGGDHPLLRFAGQGTVLPGTRRTGGRRRSRPVRAIHRPQRTLAWSGQRHLCLKQRPQGLHVEAAVGQRVTGTRPTATETRAQTEAHQRPPLWGGQHGIHQLEQAILAQTQGIVELPAERAKSRHQLRIDHNPSVAPLLSNRKPPMLLGLCFVQSPITNGTAYTFTVTATNAAGTSAPSLASNSVVPAVVVPPTASAPTATLAGLTAAQPGTTTTSSLAGPVTAATNGVPVTLSWGCSADSAIVPGASRCDHYVLQQSSNGGQFTDVTLPSPTATSVTLNLAPSPINNSASATNYVFRVQAVDA